MFELKTGKLFVVLMVLVATTLMLSYVPSAYAYWREDWEDDVTKKTFVPVFILYRPPGADSYQKVTKRIKTDLTLQFRYGSCPVSKSVDTTVDVDFPSGLITPSSDGIFGKKLTLTWHIWGYTQISPGGIYSRITRADLRGLTDDGWAFVGRDDLLDFEYKVYSVPDLRGTIGAWHYPESGTITLGPGTTWTHNMHCSWPKIDDIDLSVKISIEYDIYPSQIMAWFWTYWTTPGGASNYTYQTYLYIHDPTEFLDFTINADSGTWGDPTTTIHDYIFWFNEY